MKRWVLLLALAACACPNKQTAGPGAGSAGSSDGTSPPVANATTCADVKARVEGLYRAEATVKEPKRVEEAVADNTAMVMNDCATDPARFVPCIAKAPSVAALEQQCIVPLDDEGSEADSAK